MSDLLSQILIRISISLLQYVSIETNMPTFSPTEFEPTWSPTELTPYPTSGPTSVTDVPSDEPTSGPTSVTDVPSDEPTTARLGEALAGGIFLHEEELTFKTTDLETSEATEDTEQSETPMANMLTDSDLSSGNPQSLSMLTRISVLTTIFSTLLACIV